ncbi:AraC family transcriptional regulator [Ferrimonas lipolytica]|uniref:AraC family transcriptional regulator n=1 Tax=Ferrimonas lipolytica TaxID=2724191 RepID=A0A6H1UI21_9GAMM|nr:AraC family transcriptional regulator [Ferrimonas lipolytica]QIZ77866.1 AraC family transcriptional regulator [Ferrimonas lipolytica]
MNRAHNISTEYIESLLSHAEQQGYDVPELLRSVGINYRQLSQPQFPVSQFARLFQRLTELLQDEQFGMLTGGKMPSGTFRMMCYAIEHCADLGDALRRCSEFYEICKGPTIKPAISVEGEQVRFHFCPLDSMPNETMEQAVLTQSPALIRTSLSIWHHFISWMIGSRLPLEGASFTFAPQSNAQDYQLLFQCPIRFRQTDNCFWFKRNWLDRPLIQTAASWRGFLKTAPHQLVVMVNGDQSIGARIRARFGRDFSRALPSLEQMAAIEGMSARTLRRHLANEGLSYSQLKSQCRHEASLDYLNCPELSIHDVATLVGFEDPSPFIRAFKQWTGTTPGDYRSTLME